MSFHNATAGKSQKPKLQNPKPQNPKFQIGWLKDSWVFGSLDFGICFSSLDYNRIMQDALNPTSSDSFIGDDAFKVGVNYGTASRYQAAGDIVINQYFTATEAAARPEARNRIRVLVVAPDPLSTPLSPLNIAAEWNKLATRAQRFKHPVALIRLNPPTFKELQAAAADVTQPFHIIHFIAHGDGKYLALETLDGGLDLRPYDQVAECLARCQAKVILFNVCKSLPLAEETSRRLAHSTSFRGALQTFGRLTTLIAAEGDVPDGGATEFADGLYAGLFGGQSLAESVKMGERAMTVAGVYTIRGDEAAKPFEKVPADVGPILFTGDPPHNFWLAGFSPGGFVGRADELRDNIYLFLQAGNSKAALFVTGIGGIGKTTLAMAAARRYGWMFPAGIVIASARDVSGFGVLKVVEAMDSALGTEAGRSKDPASAALAVLNDGPHLLILDNLETVETPEARRELAQFVARIEAEAGSRALLTMRPRALPEFADAVRFGELRVGPLARADAIRVLEDRAQPEGRKRLKGHEAELAEAAFLHPALLVFAAGRLHLAPYKTVLSWLRELRGDSLDTEIPARLGAMVDDVDAERVAPGAARLLCTLALFSGGATEEAVEAVHPTPQPPPPSKKRRRERGSLPSPDGAVPSGEGPGVGLDQTLLQLVKGNLAELDSRDRYSAGLLVAQWARQHGPYTPAEWRAVERRHAEYFLEWARKYKRGKEDKWREYDVEWENIAAGAKWLFAQTGPEHAKLICDYAAALVPVIYFRKLAEEKDWLMAGLEAAQASGDRKREGLFCNQLGLWHNARGDYAAALGWYGKSVAISEELGNRAVLATTYNNIAGIHYARGDYAAALEWYGKSVAISEELGNRAGLAATYNNIGLIHYARGDYAAALEWYGKSVAISEELGNRAMLATTYNNIATIHYARGDYAAALEWYQKDLAINEELGNRAGLAATYNNIAGIHYARGDYAAALEWYGKSVAISEELGNRAVLATTYNNIGSIHDARGDYAAALEWLGKSVAIKEELGDRAGLATTYNNIGEVHRARGDYAVALEWFQKALTIREEIGDRAGLATTLHNMGYVALDQNDLPRALDLFTRSRDLYAEIGLEKEVAEEEERMEEVKGRRELSTDSGN